MDFLSKEWISFSELIKLRTPRHLPEDLRRDAGQAALPPRAHSTRGICDCSLCPKLICCLIGKQHTEESTKLYECTDYGVPVIEEKQVKEETLKNPITLE